MRWDPRIEVGRELPCRNDDDNYRALLEKIKSEYWHCVPLYADDEDHPNCIVARLFDKSYYLSSEHSGCRTGKIVFYHQDFYNKLDNMLSIPSVPTKAIISYDRVANDPVGYIIVTKTCNEDHCVFGALSYVLEYRKSVDKHEKRAYQKLVEKKCQLMTEHITVDMLEKFVNKMHSFFMGTEFVEERRGYCETILNVKRRISDVMDAMECSPYGSKGMTAINRLCEQSKRRRTRSF